MKKTCKRVLAVALSLIMVFSVISVGAVAITFMAIANTVTVGSDGSAVINAQSVEEAIEYMESNPDMFYQETETAVLADEAVAPVTERDEVIYPTIIIPGISQSISYLADENGDPVVNANGEELSGGLLILDSTQILPVVAGNLAVPLAKSLITQSDADGMLAEGVYNTVTQLFAIQASDKSGNPVNNLQTIEYSVDGVPTSVAAMTQDDRDYFYRMIPMTSIKDDIGEDNLYLYAFPLIGDPMKSAEGLNDYIQRVKADKGVDKVNIVTISLGGTILTAYLDKYKDSGYPDVNRIVNVVSCLQGTDVMGDFYLRNWNLEDEFFFHEYIPMIMEETSGNAALGYLINVALKIFPKSVIYSILTAAVDGILDTLMLNCPQFWAMIPADRFDEAKAKYSFIWEDAEYAELAPKIDAFHNAAVALEDNLMAFNNVDGRLVHNVVGYGLDYSAQDYCFFAAMKSSLTTNSDAIIDIDSTSLGATYAPAGEILPDEVLFAENSIISPDGSVDVSTCLFPKNVWLFEGQHHEVGRNDVVISLIGELITGEIKSVEDMSDAYPQFNGNRNTKNITRWYLEEAEEVLNAEDKSMYAEADLIELQAAYDEAQALLKTTICDSAEAEAVSDRLLNALRRVGKEGEAEDETMMDVLGIVAKFVDDTIFKVFGGNGFSDIAQTGPFPG